MARASSLRKKILKDGYWDIVECPACRSDVFIANDRSDEIKKEKLNSKPIEEADDFLEGFFLEDKRRAERERKRKEKEAENENNSRH